MERLSPKNHIAVVFCILIFSGCSTFSPLLAPEKPVFYSSESYTFDLYKTDLTSYEAITIKDDVKQRTKARDKIVYKVAGEIDKDYMTFKNSFFGERAAGQTVMDIAQLGLTSAGTLAGAGAVNILSAIATGLAGSRLSFDKNFFKEKSTDLLVTRMDALRAEQWARINLKLRNDDETYSFYEAERDLVAYYDKGSLAAAFQDIVVESGAANKKADTEIKKQIEEKYGSFITPLASDAELSEIRLLFEKWNALTLVDREAKAKEILDKFKPYDETYTSLVWPSNTTEAEKLKSIYSDSLGTSSKARRIRELLTSVFKEVNAGNGKK